MKNVFRSLPVFVFAIVSGFTLVAIDNSFEEKERIEVSFNRKMEFNDLVKLKLDLAEAGITIQYRLLEFDEQGGLESLDFRVDCNDGFSGSAKSTEIFNQTRWGFYRDYRKNAESPFGTGGLQ